MNNLQEATERICELKGGMLALDALVTTWITRLAPAERSEVLATFQQHAEIARALLLNAPVSEHTISSYEHEVARFGALMR